MKPADHPGAAQSPNADRTRSPDRAARPTSIGLLLAAGHGRRFDPTGRSSKLEIMLDGEGVAVRTARALLAACDGVIAVVRPDQVTLHAALTDIGCQVVEIPAGVLATVHEGMGSSIAAAARAALALPYLEQVLVQPADMPWVLPATIRQLIHEDNGGCPIVVPTFDGEDGHPVRFDRCLLPDLAALSGDRGARGLLLANPTHRMAVTDAGVRRDVDQPADLGGTPAA